MTCWKPRFLFLVYQLRDISVLRWEWFFTKEQATSQGLPIPASYRSTHYKSKDKLQMGGLVEGSLFYSIANLIGGLFAKPQLCCRTLLQGTMLPKTGNGTHMIEHDPLTCSIPWLHRQLCSAEVGKGKSGERGGRTSKAFAGAMDKTAIGPSGHPEAFLRFLSRSQNLFTGGMCQGSKFLSWRDESQAGWARACYQQGTLEPIGALSKPSSFTMPEFHQAEKRNSELESAIENAKKGHGTSHGTSKFRSWFRQVITPFVVWFGRRSNSGSQCNHTIADSATGTVCTC